MDIKEIINETLNKIKNNIYLKNYLLMFLMCFLLYLIIVIFESALIIPYPLILLGIYNIISIYFKNKVLLTPISIFSLIWLIIIPICSFEYPVMRALTLFEWNKIILFIAMFSIGGGLCEYIKIIKIKRFNHLTAETKKTNYYVLIVSIIALILMYIKYGGIPLFASDANNAKLLFRESPVLNLISYFGSISIIVSIIDNVKNLKNKKFIFLFALYVVLLVLSAERFFVTLLILSVVFIFSKEKIDSKLFKKMACAICLILLIFVFVLNFRGNAEQKEFYFIQSGIYDGDAKTLVNTEIIRYLGMQERLLTPTFKDIKPGLTKGTLTFAPVLKVIGVEPIAIPNIQIHGYTSKCIITKLYCDFGHLWTFFVILFSLIVNYLYKIYSRDKSLFTQYMYLTMMIVLLFSFYAYIDNFIIYFLHFPLYIKLIEIIEKVRVKS